MFVGCVKAVLVFSGENYREKVTFLVLDLVEERVALFGHCFLGVM